MIRIHQDHSDFAQCLDVTSKPEVIASGFTWTEGPVWWHNALYFNDIPSKRLLRWRAGEGVDVVLADTDFANGNTLDPKGRMVSCEHGGRRVVCREDPDRPVVTEVLATAVGGQRLNSPNDVVVRRDGTVWFTDPPYGINSDVEGYPAESEIGSSDVYCRLLDGTVTRVADDFDKPNGLAFSPDESRLYIADSGAIRGASFPGIDTSLPHHIRVFDVDGTTLSGGEVFAVIDPGVPDGLRVDAAARIWTSAGDGIHVYRDDGVRLGRIELPDATSNCCFGGADKAILFITSSGTVYQIPTLTSA